MERVRLAGVNTRMAKQNITFLDRALYIPGRTAQDESNYNDNNGFVITWNPTFGAPTVWDASVLKVLLCKAQAQKSNEIHIPNLTQFLRDLNLTGSTLKGLSAYRKKVYSALRRYQATTFEFDKKTNKGLRTYLFSPFDSVLFPREAQDFKAPEFIVKFNEYFLEECQASFSVLQNIDKSLQLVHSPIASRLYDILITKAYGMRVQGHFPIGLDKLFEKLGLKDVKYASDKLRRLEKGMKEVQKVLGVKYEVTATNPINILFYSTEAKR